MCFTMCNSLSFEEVYEVLAASSFVGHEYGSDGCFRVFYDGAFVSCCLVVQTALSTFPTRDMREVPVRSLRVGFVSFADLGSIPDMSRTLEFMTPMSLSLVSQVVSVLQDLCVSCRGGLPNRMAIVDKAVASLQSLGFVLGDFPIYEDA